MGFSQNKANILNRCAPNAVFKSVKRKIPTPALFNKHTANLVKNSMVGKSLWPINVIMLMT